MDTQVLLAYDGSPAAEQAIRSSAALFASSTATVLTVWEPPLNPSAGLAGDPTFPVAGYDIVAETTIEHTLEDHAAAIAERGAVIAANAGFTQVTARTELLDKHEWKTILAVADELGAAAIVMGTRGLSGLKSALLGSVSHSVVQHAQLPVLLVPHE